MSPNSARAALNGSRPNIVLILTDDQGYGDLACNGNPIIKTPNLDRLSAESVRFIDFHVSPTCSPTRSSILSGKHEFKNGVTHTLNERERMSLQTTTIAEVLLEAGYTTAIFGKWHLGDEDAYQPQNRGFDEVFIHGDGGIGAQWSGSCADVPGNSYFNPIIKHNGKFEKTDGYCTDVFFHQAMKWISEVKGTKPFFAYVVPNAPHRPLECPPEYEAIYSGKVGADQAKFLGMISNIDDNVGLLTAKLKELGLDENTLVIYMNDNGGTVGRGIFNAGMRGGKNTAFNGGTRAISMWRWPQRLAPTTCDRLTAHVDIFPTLAGLAGARIPTNVRATQDGFSLVPLLESGDAPWHEDRRLFTHTGRWEPGVAPTKYTNCSVRWRNYLMVRQGNHWDLFDLRTDSSETKNIAAEHADIVHRLDKDYDAWWEQVLPYLENEQAYKTAPKVPPFVEQYWAQFGRPEAEANRK